MLLLGLVVVLSWGCSLGAGLSSYQVKVPILTLEARTFQCREDRLGQVIEPRECVALLRSDYEKIVRELKAACLALGGSPEDCQTE